MPETITRTITESLTHDDVQSALLEVVARRNPSYAKRPTDNVVFSRKWSPQPVVPPAPGMPTSPISLDVDVKVTQDVLPSAPVKTFRESTPSGESPSIWIQQFGRAMRPRVSMENVKLFGEGFVGPRPWSITPAVAGPDASQFECDLRSVHAFVSTCRAAARQRDDAEAETYWAEVMTVLWRDIGTVSKR